MILLFLLYNFTNPFSAYYTNETTTYYAVKFSTKLLDMSVSGIPTSLLNKAPTCKVTIKSKKDFHFREIGIHMADACAIPQNATTSTSSSTSSSTSAQNQENVILSCTVIKR